MNLTVEEKELLKELELKNQNLFLDGGYQRPTLFYHKRMQEEVERCNKVYDECGKMEEEIEKLKEENEELRSGYQRLFEQNRKFADIHFKQAMKEAEIEKDLLQIQVPSGQKVKSFTVYLGQEG